MQYTLTQERVIPKVKISQKRIRKVQDILNQTAGLWRGRKLNPIAYQRAMRASYAGEKWHHLP